jgi:hypothetical protein
MKKVVVFFLVAFMAVTISAQGLKVRQFNTSPMNYTDSFNVVYQKALELNSNRFANLNKIQIGDTILFPAHSGLGTEAWVSDAPENGVNDCIWRLTHKYLKGQLKTAPVETPEKFIPSTPDFKIFDYDYWGAIGLIALVILLILIYLIMRFWPVIRTSKINSHPVLPGGLSDNALRAMQQINGITSGLQIVKVERGQIFGNIPTKVKMHFSDKDRNVNLISGDNAYRVTEFNGLISYYRQHCGNLIAPVANGQFSLPASWVFVPYTNEQSTWSAPEVEESKSVVVAEEKSPIEVIVRFADSENLSGTEIATILEAAGNMANVPLSITCGDLVVKFYKDKDKNKEE